MPSKYGNYIYTDEKSSVESDLKLVCYYSTPIYKKGFERNLLPNAIDPHLCTHLNIGIVDIANCTLQISDVLKETFKQTERLKAKNDKLKILLWVGGAGEVSGFSEMVLNHSNRKKFIQSLKATLEEYRLDGIDLDWEFPNGFSKERMHFSQLLHEIRREYQREHRTYLLSLAVAAPAVFVDMSYDVPQINDNVDYINIMTYDYHFYSKETPYTGKQKLNHSIIKNYNCNNILIKLILITGLNAPLYKRHNEIGFFATLNINYTVNYWMSKGLNRSKIVIGLPTYGHSFRLVNPFNTRMGAPAEGFGSVGANGFVTYSDVCYFRKMNFNVRMQYDVETCSPYLFTGNEWISYEDERSLTCKTNFMKNNNFAGIMVFSLNTDDYVSDCDDSKLNENAEQKGEKTDFPLLRKIHSILFQNATH